MYAVLDSTTAPTEVELYPTKSVADEHASDTAAVVEVATTSDQHVAALLSGLRRAANTGALRVPPEVLDESLDTMHPHLQQVVFDEFVMPLLEAYSRLEYTDARNESASATANELLTHGDESQ